MYDETVTTDLSKFGSTELGEAGRLLSAYGDSALDKTEYLTSQGLQVWFNMSSGYVFLCDEDYNIAMMNGDCLEDWFTCPICGHEGFREEMTENDHGDDPECREYLEQIGIEVEECEV